MLESTKMRALPLLNRGADLAPATQACCGACRTCLQTNLFALAVAGIATAGAFIARRLANFAKDP
jgi:hypothetical protein